MTAPTPDYNPRAFRVLVEGNDDDRFVMTIRHAIGRQDAMTQAKHERPDATPLRAVEADRCLQCPHLIHEGLCHDGAFAPERFIPCRCEVRGAIDPPGSGTLGDSPTRGEQSRGEDLPSATPGAGTPDPALD